MEINKRWSSLTLSLTHCIEHVSNYDHDKYLALMTCDDKLKKIMFPIYAFNIEISRIPWITHDKMIAEMRLQWWYNLLSSMEENSFVEKHPIAEALNEHLSNNKSAIKLLKETVKARNWDIYSEHHESELDLWKYIEHTSSNLLMSCLGFVPSINSYGQGIGMASYLMAVSNLVKFGKNPLPNCNDEAIHDLSLKAVEGLRKGRDNNLDKHVTAGLRLGWMAPIILKRIIKEPRLVITGRLQSSEFRKKLRLLKLTLLNSY